MENRRKVVNDDDHRRSPGLEETETQVIGLRTSVAQWSRESNIFRHICQSTSSEWRGFESRWFCRSGFEFAKTQLSILNH